MKRRLRQDLHHAEARGLEHHVGRRGYPSLQSGINKIHGTIQYLRGIERELGDKLHARWIKILEDSGHAVSYTSTGTATQRDVLFLIDESVVDGPSGRLLALALVVVEDIEIARSGLSAFLEDRLAAALGTTAPSVLETEGLHWNELTPDDRTRVTECVRALPFRAFIAYGALPAQDPATYTSVYAKLLRRLLDGRFVRYDQCRVIVKAEENSKVKPGTLGSTISASYQHLVSINSRRPVAAPDHEIAKKRSDAALPLPDLLLGIFADYARINLVAGAEAGAKKRRKPGAQAELRFEHVRDRVRAVYDLDAGVIFSRRHPFRPWGPPPSS